MALERPTGAVGFMVQIKMQHKRDDPRDAALQSRVGQSSAPPVQSPFNIERPKRDRIDPNIGDKMMTVTGRIWTYVRDDRPFGGRDPPPAHLAQRATKLEAANDLASPKSRSRPLSVTILAKLCSRTRGVMSESGASSKILFQALTGGDVGAAVVRPSILQILENGRTDRSDGRALQRTTRCELSALRRGQAQVRRDVVPLGPLFPSRLT
jgi:hypothetical protein